MTLRLKPFENTVGKGENAVIPQCFLPHWKHFLI